MTAKQARDLAPIGWILKKIRKAVEDGKYTADIGFITMEQEDTLNSLGYTLSNENPMSGQRKFAHFEISWDIEVSGEIY